MNKLTVTQTISHEFSIADINDLVVTALEGGINYWCGKAEIKKQKNGFFGVADEDQDKITYASDVIGYGGVLILHDAESSDKWELTLDNFLKGIKMYCEVNGMALNNLMDNYDADTADQIIQYAVFNELTFS